MSDLTTAQLEISRSMAPMLERIASAQKTIKSEMMQQVKIAQALKKTVGDFDTTKAQEGFSDLNSNVDKLLDGIDNISPTSKGSIDSLIQNNERGGKSFKKLGGMVGFVSGVFSGLFDSIKRVLSVMKHAIVSVANFSKAILEIGVSIVSIPFKMFNGIVEMANKVASADPIVKRAMEKIREEYGYFEQEGPKTIRAMASNLKGFAETGLSAWTVFGNFANKLEAFLELSKAMGPQFENFADEIREGEGAILGWWKGLGLSGEQLKAVANRASSFGTSLATQFKSIQKQVFALGKKFGVSQKLISRDVTKALSDVGRFGGATVKELAEASVYARKLGLDLDKISGTLGAYETFDQAAENAAKLSQSFGVNVDAFKLMEAQNPADQIDILRKSFAAAGVEASTFNRQQLRLLASTTGLDEETARQVFSMKNQGISLESIKKKGSAAEKTTLTQAEAMKQLSSSIERLAVQFTHSGGLLSKFIKGIIGGITEGSEFRKLMINLTASFNTLIQSGRRLGKAIAQLPAVKNFFGGLADIFDKGRFQRFVKGATDELVGFIQGKNSFEDMMSKIREKFLDFFDVSKGPGKRVLSGFKGIFKAMMTIAGKAMEWMTDQFISGISILVDILSGTISLSAAGANLGFLSEVFEPLITSLGKVIGKFVDYFGSKEFAEKAEIIGKSVLDWAKKSLVPALETIAPWLGAALFGPALLKGAFSSLGGMLAGGTLDKMKKKLSGPKSVASIAGDSVPEPSVVKKLGGAIGATKSWGVRDAVQFGLKIAAAAVALAIGGVAFAGAILLMWKILDGVPGEEILIQLGIIASLVLMVIPIMYMASKISAGMFGKAVIGLIGLATMTIAIALLGVAIISMYSKVVTKLSPESLVAVGTFLESMAKVFLIMIPVTVAAGLIGAAIITSLGFGAAAIFTGIAMLASVVAGVADSAFDILKKLNDLKINPTDFEKKTNAFTGIMNSISGFAGKIGDILKIADGGFFEGIFGSSFTEKIEKMTEFLKELIGGVTPPKGIMGIVNLVFESIKSMPAGSHIQKNAASFTGVMQAVTSLIEAVKPPPQLFEKLRRAERRAEKMKGAKIETTAEKLTAYMGGMSGMFTKVMGAARRVFKRIPKLTEGIDIKKAEVFTNTLGSVVSLIATITPNPELIKSLKTTSIIGNSALSSNDTIESIDFKGLEDLFKAMVDKMTEFIGTTLIRIKTFLTGIGNDFTPEQIEKLSKVGPVIGAVASLISALSSGLASIPQAPSITTGGYGNLDIIINNNAPKITEIMEALADGPGGSGILRRLVDSLVAAVSSVPTTDEFTKAIENVSKMFDIMGLIPRLAKDFSEMPIDSGMSSGEMSVPQMTPEELEKQFVPMITFVEGFGIILPRLIGPFIAIGKVLNDKKTGIDPKIVDRISGFFNFLRDSINFINKFGTDSDLKVSNALDSMTIGQTVTNLSLSFTNIASALGAEGVFGKLKDDINSIAGFKWSVLDKNLKEAGKEMSGFAANIETGYMIPAIEHLIDISQKTKELNDSLAGIGDVGLDKTIKMITSKFGMTGKMNYTVKKESVNVTVNVNVAIDSQKLETAILTRNKKSILRDRLNMIPGLTEGQKLMFFDNRTYDEIVTGAATK